MLDLPKLFFNQFHRRLDPSLYRQVSIRSLMDELRFLKIFENFIMIKNSSNIVMIDICAKTKQVLLREITNEKFENLSTLRHELLLLLLESTEFKDSHTLSKTKIKYEWLLIAYQTK